MPFTEDLSVFLADFGQSVTLNGATVTVIFDRNYAVADIGAGVSSTAPALTLKTSDVPASPVGKAAVVSGTNYTVAEHQADGTGMSVLLLEVA